MIAAKAVENAYILILSNSIGSPIDNRIINICPDFVTLNDTHAVIASKHYVYIWQFRSQLTDVNQGLNMDVLKNKITKEFAFYIEDSPNINDIYSEHFTTGRTSLDPICATFMNEKYVLLSNVVGW